MRNRSSLLGSILAAAAAAAASGCSHDFRNPAEDLGAGEVGGRTVGGGTPLEGVALSVRGSVLDGSSRTAGRFGLPALPVGTHTLVFRVGRDRAAQRVVEVPFARDGRAAGIWLGDVDVPATVAIQGAAVLADQRPPPDGGVVVDEETGATAAIAGGRFVLEGLPVGAHTLRAFARDAGGAPLVGGPLALTLGPDDAGRQVGLASAMELRAAAAGTASVKLRVRTIAGATGPGPGDVTVTGLPTPPTFDSTGLAQVAVPEGKWTVTVGVPASFAGVTPPREATFVALAGETVDLGTLYAVEDAAASRAAHACHADAECAPTGACAQGVCQGWTPPGGASAALPFCDASTLGCAAGPLQADAPHIAVCAAGAFTGGTVAVTCGTCCTPDGLAVVCAPAAAAGCAAP